MTSFSLSLFVFYPSFYSLPLFFEIVIHQHKN